MTIDLHTHSTASDGQLSPDALIDYAVDRGVTTLALTDHDTVDGLDVASRAAERHGITFVNGVELSVRWQKRTLHIVGLGFDPENETLAAALDALQAARRERAAAMGDRLARLGVADAFERARAQAGVGQITRPHFAQLLVADGLCRSAADAFKRYLRPGKPGHVQAEWIALDNAIGAIQAAGGIAVLAHPFGYRLSHAWRHRALDAFQQAGGDAIEVVTGVSHPEQNRLASLEATHRRLLASAGSDFHSPEQFWLVPGRLAPLPPGTRPVSWLDCEA